MRSIFGNRWHVVVLSLLVLASVHIPSEAKEQGKRVLFVCLTLGNPFYQEMISGLDAASANVPNLNVEKQSGRSATDVKGQIDIIHSFVASADPSQLSGVILVPADSGAPLAHVVRELNDAKIPVINVDILMNADALAAAGAHVDAFIGSDNIAGGKEGANAMAKLLPSGGNILVLLGSPGEATMKARRDGFVGRIEELRKQSNYRATLTERIADWSEAKANIETSTILATGVQVDGIFAENDLMALGAAKAVGGRDLKKKPVIVGYDAIPEARSAIERGELCASVSQNPALMGKRAVEYLQNIWAGHPPQEKREITPVSVITGTHCR
jgi:ribose transport system substrate-binding protein